MRILHLSDTHLYADPSARHYDRIDTTAALQGLLARFAALPPIDAIVHTGDASEDGTAGSYQLLHEILDPFAAAHGATLAVAKIGRASCRERGSGGGGGGAVK